VVDVPGEGRRRVGVQVEHVPVRVHPEERRIEARVPAQWSDRGFQFQVTPWQAGWNRGSERYTHPRWPSCFQRRLANPRGFAVGGASASTTGNISFRFLTRIACSHRFPPNRSVIISTRLTTHQSTRNHARAWRCVRTSCGCRT
jgi:hypothetical protein